MTIGQLLASASENAEYMKYKDPNQPVEVRIQDLLKRMTLEEKIGQMVQTDRGAASAEVMNKYFIVCFQVIYILAIGMIKVNPLGMAT
ncbi:Glycoside hydrolase, superfamily [Corchorus capsularis]|uniref:Glycoside hydrolase, superfamily n=1 Tax=Corchorus capsularis TaxID=210143 RepID=A0A1R3HC53_COCAP|nr:Glycoside hydrolase, superfamily [Corchorus capsularis]